MSEEVVFKEWCIVDLFGRTQLGGLVTEQLLAGVAFVRIDVPASGQQSAASRFFHPNAIYSLTPTTEEIARAFVRRGTPEPVERWKLLPAPESNRRTFETDGYKDRFDDEEEDPFNRSQEEDPDEEEEEASHLNVSAVTASAVTEPGDLPFD